MNKEGKLDEHFSSLKLKPNLMEEYELTASIEEKEERDKAMNLLDSIKNEMQTTLYPHSTHYPIVILLAYSIDRIGVTKANYHTVTNEIAKGFFELLFNLKDKVKQREEQAVRSFNEMNALLW